MNQFLCDVLKGLQSTPKYLQSKYFYNKKGDEIFMQIMNSDEYYLTDCEMEIFSTQTSEIADIIIDQHYNFDVVELGPGDAVKSMYLLKELVNKKAISTYFPVDISTNIINLLHKKLPEQLPNLNIHGLNGEYLAMLSSAKEISDKIKLVLFLGSNIGNIVREEVQQFCQVLRSQLSKGDMVLIGMDLVKNPKQILAAYNDHNGYTRNFNLNLLQRINDELSGDFSIEDFEHYATYDPATGACKSYLISLKDQDVTIGNNTVIHFGKNEPVFMEVSQKYSVEESNAIAKQSGFEPIAHFFDKNKWFMDVIWKCV
ncbi:MAG: L-histidine N(alpha)-methyltransferase [Bacteroidota bacterium]|nr:L-histidine N(alpha)-methyltransferase [Bacteroidota bacterium]